MEAERPCLVLCHRLHSRVLLMDGLYATTKTEGDEAAVTANRHKPVSTGDVVCVSTNPSSTLEFDGTKCADSIAILSDSSTGGKGASVHQRASKVWGTVLSTRHFSPKSGIHRWAVRLDKCERGHIFIGVATAQGSTRTYVGGDKYGWGMIGTQALWHDRRKIRGDFGATLQSGATVIASLDTEAGTLSFGLWKDSSTTSSLSVDPLVQNVVSSKRQGHIPGTVEEWGVAFEGLPLDSRLYPAIGLYQRDDRVTLLSVVEGTGRSSGLSEGAQVTAAEYFYPRQKGSDLDIDSETLVHQVRRHNDLLSWDGVRYSAETLKSVVVALDRGSDHFAIATVLPSLAASLCFLSRTISVRSTRSALVLMPHIRICIQSLARFLEKHKDIPLFWKTIA